MIESNSMLNFIYPAVCGAIPVPEHGTVTYTSDVQSAGVEATYVCDEIYQLNGPEIVTCLEDGTWSGEADCSQIFGIPM